MTTQYFTVLTTSGWQGDGWTVRKQFESRREALAFAGEIRRPDARSGAYIVAVVGDYRPCDRHDGWICGIVDTSRVPVREPHLRGRRVHARILAAEEEEAES